MTEIQRQTSLKTFLYWGIPTGGYIECGNMMSAYDIAGFFHQPTVLAPK